MDDFLRVENKLNDCCFIAVGYRCFTAAFMKIKKHNLVFETLPFDNGFFPPQSIASILKCGNMNLLLDDEKEPKNFSFCKKYGEPNFRNRFLSTEGKSFQVISEIEIDEQLKSGYDNKLLDHLRGYYVLNEDHDYVLAHYLWHKSSEKYKTNYRNKIDIISSMFQRRLKRLNEICAGHKNKFFIHYHYQPYNSVRIRDIEYDLTDMDILKNQLTESFGENTLLCFSNFKKKNENGIFYFDHTEYKNFCKYASSNINNK